MARRAPQKSGIGRAAGRLLAALAAGAATRGRPLAPDVQLANAAALLVSADLAARRPDGSLEITAAGRAHYARLTLARMGSAIDPFRAQHLDVVQADIATADGRARMAVDQAESPLVWLARRKGRDGRAFIEPVQLQAGERLRADVTRAQMLPRVTANWSAAVAQGRRAGLESASTITEVVVAARQRVQRALDAVGPEFSGILLDVCCFLKGLEDVERERNWPPRSAKVVLQLGLDRLARHYGYAAEAHGVARAAIRAWSAPDAATAGE
jgi:hypothetical protein